MLLLELLGYVAQTKQDQMLSGKVSRTISSGGGFCPISGNLQRFLLSQMTKSPLFIAQLPDDHRPPPIWNRHEELRFFSKQLVSGARNGVVGFRVVVIVQH